MASTPPDSAWPFSSATVVISDVYVAHFPHPVNLFSVLGRLCEQVNVEILSSVKPVSVSGSWENILKINACLKFLVSSQCDASKVDPLCESDISVIATHCEKCHSAQSQSLDSRLFSENPIPGPDSVSEILDTTPEEKNGNVCNDSSNVFKDNASAEEDLQVFDKWYFHTVPRVRTCSNKNRRQYQKLGKEPPEPFVIVPDKISEQEAHHGNFIEIDEILSQVYNKDSINRLKSKTLKARTEKLTTSELSSFRSGDINLPANGTEIIQDTERIQGIKGLVGDPCKYHVAGGSVSNVIEIALPPINSCAVSEINSSSMAFVDCSGAQGESEQTGRESMHTDEARTKDTVKKVSLERIIMNKCKIQARNINKRKLRSRNKLKSKMDYKRENIKPHNNNAARLTRHIQIRNNQTIGLDNANEKEAKKVLEKDTDCGLHLPQTAYKTSKTHRCKNSNMQFKSVENRDFEEVQNKSNKLEIRETKFEIEAKNEGRIKYGQTAKSNINIVNSSLLTTRQLQSEGINRKVHLKNPLKCQECLKEFRSKKVLQRHMKCHRSAENSCDKCGKLYKDVRRLTLHMESHSDHYVKPEFPCGMCSKKFSTKYVLAYHLKSEHLGIKQSFVCPICRKSFSQKHSYIQHANVHLGLKSYSCEVCGKQFAYGKSLKEHRFTHKEERQFLCTVCKKTFRQASGLAIHLRVHNKTKDYVCSTCGKGFTQKPALVRHERIHAGEKPFKCGLCHRTFNDSSILRRHMIHIHKKNPQQWRQDTVWPSFTGNNVFIRVLNEDNLPNTNTLNRNVSLPNSNNSELAFLEEPACELGLQQECFLNDSGVCTDNPDQFKFTQQMSISAYATTPEKVNDHGLNPGNITCHPVNEETMINHSVHSVNNREAAFVPLREYAENVKTEI